MSHHTSTLPATRRPGCSSRWTGSFSARLMVQSLSVCVCGMFSFAFKAACSGRAPPPRSSASPELGGANGGGYVTRLQRCCITSAAAASSGHVESAQRPPRPLARRSSGFTEWRRAESCSTEAERRLLSMMKWSGAGEKGFFFMLSRVPRASRYFF